MIQPITAASILPYREKLESHPVYEAVQNIQDLRLFMEHHVYSVWDFMSLVKYLQHRVAPAACPWVPPKEPMIARFINELVLEEETDQAMPVAGEPQAYCSHFELYCRAMAEIGADSARPLSFIRRVDEQGVAAVLPGADIPPPARAFCTTTFGFIDSGQPHVVAAALALGREHIIPPMFRALLKKLGVTEQQAPQFHYYLERHIHLDEDAHGPMSLRLLNALCEDDAQKREQAEAAAEEAVAARGRFWDGVLEALQAR